MMHLRAVGPRYLFVCFEGTCRLGYQKEDRDTGNVCCCYLHPETCHILFLCATKPSGEKSRLWFGRCLKKRTKPACAIKDFPFCWRFRFPPLPPRRYLPGFTPLSIIIAAAGKRRSFLISKGGGGGIASDNTKYIEIYICTILRSRMSPE